MRFPGVPISGLAVTLDEASAAFPNPIEDLGPNSTETISALIPAIRTFDIETSTYRRLRHLK